MLLKKLFKYFLPFELLILIVAVSCRNETVNRKEPINLYEDPLDSIAVVWAPDIREAVCEARLVQSDKGLILKGETDIPEAKDSITGFLKARNVNFTDSLILLPDTAVIKEPWGLVNVSVCNIRSSGTYISEMVSQALMGTPVKILKQERGWYLIQTPDRYLGWVDSDAVVTFSATEHQVWKLSPRIIYLEKTGDVYGNRTGKKIVSDIVAGCILRLLSSDNLYYEILFPDGRKGYIDRKEAIPFKEWADMSVPEGKNLLKTAESFMGIPYLWGGTSVKGFDCSGFVKTVYFLNGVILARDASLQFRHGIRIRRSGYPDSLKTGDLLFFGSVRNGRPHPTHVGMYTSDTEFIHSSGMVRVNSLDSTRNDFSRRRRDTFIGVRRIDGAEEDKGIQRISSHSWYFNN